MLPCLAHQDDQKHIKTGLKGVITNLISDPCHDNDRDDLNRS